VVHVRQIEDKTLTFIVSGKLWRNSLVMQDKETGSLWSHVTGECLEGEYEGMQLEMVPVVQTTWAQWSADHPETRVLKKSEEIKSSPYESYFNDPERTGLFRTTWLQDRLPGKTLIHGVKLGVHSLAVTDTLLSAGEPVKGMLGEVEVELSRQEDGGITAHRTDSGSALIVRTAYWFAWSTYFPNTAVLD
jgi:hypothetical protein